MYSVASILLGAWIGDEPSGRGRPLHSCPRSSTQHFSTNVPPAQPDQASQCVVAETYVGEGPVVQALRRDHSDAVSSKSLVQALSTVPHTEIQLTGVVGAHCSKEPVSPRNL